MSFPVEAGLPFGNDSDFKYGLMEVHYDVECYICAFCIMLDISF